MKRVVENRVAANRAENNVWMWVGKEKGQDKPEGPARGKAVDVIGRKSGEGTD